jgi:Omp85 superfamily domain
VACSNITDPITIGSIQIYPSPTSNPEYGKARLPEVPPASGCVRTFWQGRILPDQDCSAYFKNCTLAELHVNNSSRSIAAFLSCSSIVSVMREQHPAFPKWVLAGIESRQGRRFEGLVIAALLGFFTMPGIAQEPGPLTNGVPVRAAAEVTDQSKAETKKEEEKKKKEEKEKHPSRGAIVVAPLPTSSPALGTGVIPVAGYIFSFSEKDKISPPSTIGGAGLWTNDGSRGFALGGQLFFKENRYQITAGYAHGNLDYNIYGPGSLNGPGKVPLRQKGHAIFAEALRREWWQFFFGPRFFDGNSLITLKSTEIGDTPIPPDLGAQTTIRSIGLHVKRDTRPDHFYPVKGTLTDFTADFAMQAIGSKYTFQSYKLTFNKYVTVRKNQIVALGSYFCGTGGLPPFYGNCIYGSQNQLRGYTAGRYFDRYMMASQAEYRLSLPLRLGVVAFGGIGGVIPGQEQFLVRNSFFLPSGGGGLRFNMSKKYHVNLRADVGYGKDGHTFSLGVGEAF